MQAMYHLQLFIAGRTPKSAVALANLNAFCEQYLKNNYFLEIIDLAIHPERAGLHGILAIPTLIKKDPEPLKKLIGNLSDQAKMLSILNIAAA